MLTSTSAANSTNSKQSGWTLFILVISRTRRGKKLFCSEFLGGKVVVTYTVTGEVQFIAGRTRSKEILSEVRKLPKTRPQVT